MGSGDVSISCRSLNELRALLLEANRHSPGPERDLSREVHKAEWRLKEQKLKDDIKGLREKLVVLVRALKPILGRRLCTAELGWGGESEPFALVSGLCVFFCAAEHKI